MNLAFSWYFFVLLEFRSFPGFPEDRDSNNEDDIDWVQKIDVLDFDDDIGEILEESDDDLWSSPLHNTTLYINIEPKKKQKAMPEASFFRNT